MSGGNEQESESVAEFIAVWHECIGWHDHEDDGLPCVDDDCEDGWCSLHDLTRAVDRGFRMLRIDPEMIAWTPAAHSNGHVVGAERQRIGRVEFAGGSTLTLHVREPDTPVRATLDLVAPWPIPEAVEGLHEAAVIALDMVIHNRSEEDGPAYTWRVFDTLDAARPRKPRRDAFDAYTIRARVTEGTTRSPAQFTATISHPLGTDVEA